MSTVHHNSPGPAPLGQIGFLQLPATDVTASGAFYGAVFGWSVQTEPARFHGPGVTGEFTTGRSAAASGGPLIWLCAEHLFPTLQLVQAYGGQVRGRPRLDDGQRWLVEVDDPAGNRIGVVVPARAAQAQTLVAVRDVEASSRWYQQLLGLHSDHGGPNYERLVAAGTLVLQLHRWDVEHQHGPIGDPHAPVGNGALLWFGEVADFDGVVTRAEQLGAPVVLAPHRNPPHGQGNGPSHREIWLKDPDGYTVVVASADGEAFEDGEAPADGEPVADGKPFADGPSL